MSQNFKKFIMVYPQLAMAQWSSRG